MLIFSWSLEISPEVSETHFDLKGSENSVENTVFEWIDPSI